MECGGGAAGSVYAERDLPSSPLEFGAIQEGPKDSWSGCERQTSQGRTTKGFWYRKDTLKSPLLYVTPALFVLFGLAGTGVHLAGYDLSRVEVVIALSVIVAGALVLSRRRPGLVALGLFFALAGVFHGYAYAESIVGAQSAPLVAYLAGLALTQFVVIMAVATGLRKLNARGRGSLAARAESFAGGGLWS